ncbi:hypothetical protein PAAG_03895 [Paracoccidioides lutzii Pb01]|uniref:Uncharacterized protein n=1 Tax=Paracoccidioides lutzii (strain ATCC MYA-826 / Pb01) TaxID=502779 RepID=C1GZF1_PARBA|nr:hypothetical protein PAAG_03895 [Paracoccidioides lutzii Pb01]EEH41974.2 hypothetical protein PAAG_03895 [Paracoccidioides lutzii Pb01]
MGKNDLLIQDPRASVVKAIAKESSPRQELKDPFSVLDENISAFENPNGTEPQVATRVLLVRGTLIHRYVSRKVAARPWAIFTALFQGCTAGGGEKRRLHFVSWLFGAGGRQSPGHVASSLGRLVSINLANLFQHSTETSLISIRRTIVPRP